MYLKKNHYNIFFFFEKLYFDPFSKGYIIWKMIQHAFQN